MLSYTVPKELSHQENLISVKPHLVWEMIWGRAEIPPLSRQALLSWHSGESVRKEKPRKAHQERKSGMLGGGRIKNQ